MQPNQIAKERIYLNKERDAVVPEGTDAAFLWASKGDEIPAEACERFGIKDGKAPADKEKKPSGNKGGKSPANKDKKPTGDKGAAQAKIPQDINHSGDPPATNPDIDVPADLADIAGIGDVTKGALIASGIADVAALAAVDPENPPEVKTLPAAFDWAAAVAAAKGTPAQGGDA